jgi:glycosyltransferase involved in cell wall biosynthesis
MSIPRPLVSILINNYNYGRFLREAIDSALNQTYSNIEVIVVDDGSTDDSREIIASYGNRIIPVMKENGGQASAFNAGFEISKGDILCLLDSDDFYYPEKVERALQVLSSKLDTRPILLYHLLDVVDECSDRVGAIFPPRLHACEPNLLDFARKYAFLPFAASPTSGLAISRNIAERIFPIPDVKISADDFVVRAAALLGEIHGIPDALGAYRRHGTNKWLDSQALKSAEFVGKLEAYLNDRLVGSKLDPVIDFYNSTYGRPYAEGSFARLSRLAFAVLRRCQDRMTIRFFLKTEFMALKCLLRGHP